jgi:hypothetical protein
MKERRMQGMLKQTEIKYIRRRGNFVQNVNQIPKKKQAKQTLRYNIQESSPTRVEKNSAGK